MRRAAIVLLLLAALLPAAPAAATASAEAAPSYRARTVTLDGVGVRLRRNTRQVVTVNHTSGHRARVVLWTLRKGRWVAGLRTTDGRIGYGGLVAGTKRRQGTGTTPTGTYDLRSAFGTHRRTSAWDLPYRRIRKGDFWVQDNASDFYNRYRNQRQGGFRWWLPSSHDDASERLTDYGKQYEYSIVLDYNWSQVRRRGSGIFLHVNGRGATAGCVSAPRSMLRKLMNRLDPDRDPVIAIGR